MITHLHITPKCLAQHTKRSNRTLAWLLVLLSFALLSPTKTSAQSPQGATYIERQTYGGQAFFKDNNVWVYSATFAKTFGMPPEYVQEIVGFEAAAFRVQTMGFDMCGYGGKLDSCAPVTLCLTDVYFDESKTPLPWATGQQTDWLAMYNSTRWLEVPGDVPITPKPPSGVFPNVVTLRQATLHPFADPLTKKEATVFASYQVPTDDDRSFSNIGIYGYKRSAVAGLTMLTLSYRCGSRNSNKKDTVFRIEVRDEIYSPTLLRFHEFRLPQAFEKRVDAHQKAMQERTTAFFKSVTNLK